VLLGLCALVFFVACGSTGLSLRALGIVGKVLAGKK
jgi:hypothetical protein